jgi:hypothetical protein
MDALGVRRLSWRSTSASWRSASDRCENQRSVPCAFCTQLRQSILGRPTRQCRAVLRP